IMDRIVGLFQREAQQQLARLRLVGVTILTGVLLLLVALGLFVLRPATRAIQSQIGMLAASEEQLRHARDELEVRVLERTKQLQQANASLQAEMREREQAESKMRAVSEQLAHTGRV